MVKGNQQRTLHVVETWFEEQAFVMSASLKPVLDAFDERHGRLTRRRVFVHPVPPGRSLFAWWTYPCSEDVRTRSARYSPTHTAEAHDSWDTCGQVERSPGHGASPRSDSLSRICRARAACSKQAVIRHRHCTLSSGMP